MATVELKPVSDLFGYDFFVPSYQRGYRWTSVQVRELLEDLYDFAEEKHSGDSYYCLQPVIVKQRDNKWELVDGQQRLTALWLISALYYCSNREDVVNIERKQYSLAYQEKDIFTNLFDDINEFVEEGSLKQIVKEFESKKQNSIDSRNLIKSMEYISGFSYKNKTAKGVLAQIFDLLRPSEEKNTNPNVRIIWYVLDEDEDAIQTFTNINANKIELTNAELIKAVLLHSREEEDENKIQDMALQWEEIEKGLNNNSFWNFIVNKKRNEYRTRIDYLFEIWCAKNGRVVEKNGNDDRHEVFRIVNERLDAGDSADKIWKEIQGIYETLMDWYSDYYYFHTIGLLIIINEKDKDVDIINDLYALYASSSKKEFKAAIIEKIKTQYFSSAKTTPFEIFKQDQIVNDLGDVTFHIKNQVKNVLLLYNIAMLINANNTYERFPFELYKDETWDIEHINPQTPKEASEEEQKAWLESYRHLLSTKTGFSGDDSLLDDIDFCIKNHLSNFEDVSKQISSCLGIIDNDSISNLVLLDAATNRGYKNACFLEKRKKILEVERTCNNDEKYIPIGTKWVFLKGYENAESLIVWGASDMQDYTNDMAKSIFSMLGGEIK